MTNEQLKILLESQALLLNEAIEKAAGLMPEDAEREMINILTAQPPGKKAVEGDKYTALKPLYDHLELIERQVFELLPIYYTSGADQSGSAHRIKP